MLDEETVLQIKERNGVIGLIMAQHQLRSGVRLLPTWNFDQSFKVIRRHIDKIAEITGSYEHVALGTDFDGFIKPTLSGLEHMGDLERLEEGWYTPTAAPTPSGSPPATRSVCCDSSGRSSQAVTSADSKIPSRRWITFIVIAFVGVGISWLLQWLTDVNAGWAMTGIFAGLALGGFWAPVRTETAKPPRDPAVAPQPLSKLVRTALPLTLPLLIVIVAGTSEAPWWVQMLVGAVASLFGWAIVVRPEVQALGGRCRSSRSSFLPAPCWWR